jgi:hypothetical protein
MNNTKTYYCEHCARFVAPTRHDVTEVSKFDGESTWEVYFELRCPTCIRMVVERVACIQCKAAEPESGADHCTKCLDALQPRPITNSTGEYLRAHADIESEGSMSPPDVTVEDIFKDGLGAIRFTAAARVDQIARACEMFSTDTHEVYGKVMFVSGKPVVALIREPRPAGLEATLRHGSEEPLSNLLRRQAS